MRLKEIKKPEPGAEEDGRQLSETVSSILQRVKQEGDRALRHYEKKFDNYEPESFLVSPEEAAQAQDKLPAEIIEELDFTIDRVTAFARAQKDSLIEFEKEMWPGQWLGHKTIPLESCGLYVPAGRYPCLTSAVLSVIPAKVAGVKRIIACSPPGKDGGVNLAILYTMHQMGVDEIYCFGGAQAIAAFAFGTESIRPVAFIAGPGNQYVNEAKRQVFGTVGIDLLAGPSECLVIADQTARADFIAADLIAQCEHDPQVRTGLVTISEPLARETLKEVERQLKERTTQEVAAAAWRNKGVVVVVDSIEDAARYADEFAPEHLEVHTARPRQLLPLLNNYGALFLGQNTPEVYADKVAGLNQPLPTGGAARYTGGLWVGMFLKVVTYQEVDVKASLKLAQLTETQGAYEGMDAHRYAASIRLENLKN
ncbi:MAG: histidinol dehydrogenase [Deltaproteobacteria bacterium]|nr:histidinol dehydrogenase [Deltaproteobacteria bacterium]